MLSSCESSHALESFSSSKAKILIIDDQIENIQLLHMLLEDEYDIFMATSGEQGIKQCRHHMPDLILLDITMPGLDGFHVCRILKDDISTAHIPIVFVTGHSDESEEAKGFELGASDYIRKPISSIILEQRINTHLTLKRQKEHLSHLAMQDGLTGVASRHRFFNTLQKLWYECVNKKEPLSIIMLDIDNFKVFNHTYGHRVGDIALKNISDILQEHIQLPHSLVARYNGEEFCCLLPFTHLRDGVVIAEELRRRVEVLTIGNKQVDGKDVVSMCSVTVSAGVVSTISNPQITTSDLLLFEVDKYLVMAKASGKNCIKYNDD